MKVFVESVFDCPHAAAWNEVQKSGLLAEVLHPLAAMQPVDAPIPERWTAGATFRCGLRLFGFLPVGVRTLVFERVDHDAHEIQTREHDPLVQRWDHLIRLQPTGDGRTRYSDEIEIEAGAMTLLVWLFAYSLYRHRHWRWRRVAHRLASQPVQAAAIS